MADDWFAGADGNDANTGATWPLRKETITSLLTVAYAAGDRLYVGPGVYREQVTIDASGAHVIGTADDASTVDVTNESTAVTGNGTGFAAAGVVAGDQLFIGNFESGTQAQTWGNNSVTFQAGTGNFQAGHIGFMIEIVTKGAYIIDTVISTDSITIRNPNAGVGVGWPAASGAFDQDYYVVSGEGPYEIEGDIGAATLTLVKPWSGPTLTELDYVIYRPVYLIADTTGVETDGVGGVVRITGTDDDETKSLARDYGVYNDWWIAPRSYWIIRGFRVDCCTVSNVYISGDCHHFTFEDMSLIDYSTYGFEMEDCTKMTIRRTVVLGGAQDNGGYSILFTHTPDELNAQSLIENVYVTGGTLNIAISDYGGMTIKNYTSGFRSYWNIDASGMAAGTAVFIHDCLLHFTANECLYAWTAGIIVEQYNNLWSNGIDRNPNVGTATNSTAYVYLPALPLLTGRGKNPMVSFFAPSQWEPTRNAIGLYGKNEDMFGVHNESAQSRRSWGAQHNYATVRSEDQFQGTFTGSLYMENAMDQQFVFPVREDWDYTVTVWVYIEANYVGDPPQVIVRQPGVAEVTVTSAGGIGTWHQLSVDFTTGPDMDWINVTLQNRNTSVLANVGCYFQDLTVN